MLGNLEQAFQLSPFEGGGEDIQLGKSKFGAHQTELIIKKIRVKNLEAKNQSLKRIANVILACSRCSLVQPQGCFEGEGQKSKEFFVAYEKYAGSFAARKKEKLEKGECFTKQEIQKLAISLFRSVSSLHKNGVYHGNLKPSNIFFPDESESLSSTIFVGEAGFVSTKAKELSQQYFAPEMLPEHEHFMDDEDLDLQAVDTFGIGLILAELISMKDIKELECLKYDKGEQVEKREKFFQQMKELNGETITKILKSFLVVNPGERQLVNSFDIGFFDQISKIEDGQDLQGFPETKQAFIQKAQQVPPAQGGGVSSLQNIDAQDELEEEQKHNLSIDKESKGELDEVELLRQRNEEFRAKTEIKMVDSDIGSEQHIDQIPSEKQPNTTETVPQLNTNNNLKNTSIIESLVINKNSEQQKQSTISQQQLVSTDQFQQPEHPQSRLIQSEILNESEEDKNQMLNTKSIANPLDDLSPKNKSSVFKRESETQVVNSQQNKTTTEEQIKEFEDKQPEEESAYNLELKSEIESKSELFKKKSVAFKDDRKLIPHQVPISLNYLPSSMVSVSELRSTTAAIFDIDQIISAIRKCCELKKIDILDIFVFYDQDYNYTLEDPMMLHKIFTILGLIPNHISEQQTEKCFQHYCIQSSKMSFLGLIQQLVSPKALFVSLLCNLLLVNKWTVLDLFEKYQNQENYWGITEFSRINDENQFIFDHDTIEFILKEFIEAADSQDSTLNPKELAQVLGFRIQTSSEMIIRQINQRMQSQIKRLSELRYTEIVQQQNESELRIQLEEEKKKQELILQKIKEREEKEAQYRQKQEKIEQQKRDYQESKKFLPSLVQLPQFEGASEGVMVNKAMFWKTLSALVQSQGFDAINSKKQDQFITSKAFYEVLVYDYRFTDCIELREFVDGISPNQKINIAKLQDKLKVASDSEIKEKKTEELPLPNEMIEEINKLFEVVDTDKSGSIEKGEIEHLMRLLGINAKDDELDIYFKTMDADGDHLISLQEFKVIMSQHIYSSMLSVKDIIDDFKALFRRADSNNEGSINLLQFNYVLNELGVVMDEEELQAVFSQVDTDKSGTVEIQELVNFIKSDCRKLTGPTALAIIKIRMCRKPSISELRTIFESLPDNCILSFLGQRLKNGLNLPSSGIKPKISALTISLKDLKLENDPIIKHTLIKGRKSVPSDISVKISLHRAISLPLPLDPQTMVNVKRMEVMVCLYDRSRKKFVGNICCIKGTINQAQLQPEKSSKQNNQGANKTGNCVQFEQDLYLKYCNFNEKRDADLEICFEFVLYYQIGIKIVAVSCGFAEIYLSEIREPGYKTLLINGGDPSKLLPIDLKYTVSQQQSAGSQISSDLKQEPDFIISVESAAKDQDILGLLPSIILMETEQLRLFKGFREFVAFNFTSTQAAYALQDERIKLFQSLINCPDTSENLRNLWNQHILSQISGDAKKEIHFMNTLLSNLEGLVQNQLFGFKVSDPTSDSLHSEELHLYRQQLFDYYANELLSQLKIRERQNINFPQMKNSGGDGFQMPKNDEEDETEGENQKLLDKEGVGIGRGGEGMDFIIAEEYRESIIGEDFLFLFATEDITNAVMDKAAKSSRAILIDFRDQISKGRFNLYEVETLSKAFRQNSQLRSLYLKFSRSSYDEDNVDKLNLGPLMTVLSTSSIKLRTLYLHLDYSDLSDESMFQKLCEFLSAQSAYLTNLNLSLEGTNLSTAMGLDLTTCIGPMWDLASLSLNVSLNPLGPDFVKKLAYQLKRLTKLTNLKLDLEKIELKEYCLSCYCGYYLRVVIQFIPLIGNCCLWCLDFFTALEKLAEAVRCMDKLQNLNLNIAQNNLGDRLIRHFEYKFGKALYTRPSLSTLVLNLKRNKLATKSIKSLSTLGISAFKVDLRYNQITEEGLQKIAPVLYSMRNLKSLSLQITEGNKREGAFSIDEQAALLSNSQMNSHPSNKSNQAGQFGGRQFLESKIIKSIASIPQIENIEISGLGGIQGRQTQNSQISKKYPVVRQMYQRAHDMNLMKYSSALKTRLLPQQDKYQIPSTYIFREEDEIDLILSLFCFSSTLEEIHLQCLFDEQILKCSLNLPFLNPISVIDFSDCCPLSVPEIFVNLLDLLKKNKNSLERLYLGGVSFEELQITSLSKTLHQITKERGRLLQYLEYSHFNLKPSHFQAESVSCLESISLMMKQFCSQFYEFNEEVFKASEQHNLMDIQNAIPDLGTTTLILTIRNLITLSYFKDQKYLEIKSFDQENAMGFRLFDLISGTEFSTIREIVVRDQLVSEDAATAHLNYVNHLDDEQFSSFMRIDLKRVFPVLETLEVVFAPSPDSLSNCMKLLSIKLLQSERKHLKSKIVVSAERQRNTEDDIQKDEIEVYLTENTQRLLWIFFIFYSLFYALSVVIPFIFANECGLGHNSTSHYIFAGISVFGLLVESTIIKEWIIPNQKPKLLKGRDKSWRRRLTEHFSSKGDVYVLLGVSLISKFDLYTNFLFLSITQKCDHTGIFLIQLIFMGLNLLCEVSLLVSMAKTITQNAIKNNISDHIVTDTFSQMTNFLRMSGISYLMAFREVQISFLFIETWKVPVSLTSNLLKLVLDNFPMIVLKIVFLITELTDTRSFVVSMTLSSVLSVVSALIFGLIFVKKFEELRYKLPSKGKFSCISYERQDLEQFMGWPAISMGDLEKGEQINTAVFEPNKEKFENPKINPEAIEGGSQQQLKEKNEINEEPSQGNEKEPLKQQEEQVEQVGDKKQESDQQNKEINASQQQQQQVVSPQKQQQQQQLSLQEDSSSCCCFPCGSCSSCRQCCSCCCCNFSCKCITNLLSIKIKDISFFYEQAIEQRDFQIRFKLSLYKMCFWIAFLIFYFLSYALPFFYYNDCTQGISNSIYYLFYGLNAFLIIIEFSLLYPLVTQMREIPRSGYNQFPYFWMFKLLLSYALKANFLTDFIVLVYGMKCQENALIFKLVFISVSVIFWLRGFKLVRYLFKALRTDSIYPVITRFTLLADLCQMTLIPKLVNPYLPEKPMTRLRIQENLFLNYTRFVCEDALMLPLNICYLVYLLRETSSFDNIRTHVIISLVISALSAILTIKWWSWPLRMSSPEDLDKLFVRHEAIQSREKLEDQEYMKKMRDEIEFGGCFRVKKQGWIAKCLGLE